MASHIMRTLDLLWYGYGQDFIDTYSTTDIAYQYLSILGVGISRHPTIRFNSDSKGYDLILKRSISGALRCNVMSPLVLTNKLYFHHHCDMSINTSQNPAWQTMNNINHTDTCHAFTLSMSTFNQSNGVQGTWADSPDHLFIYRKSHHHCDFLLWHGDTALYSVRGIIPGHITTTNFGHQQVPLLTT